MTLHNAYARQRITHGRNDVDPGDPRAVEFVQEAEIGDGWLHPHSSNYTFVVELALGDKAGFGVYKPASGETPLWDFPVGTLHARECAAFEMSRLLAWPIVPPTVVREGEAGSGSLQLYVPSPPDSNFFTLRGDHRNEFLRMAVFDVIANNADRKGGHCFTGPNGDVWAVDHGLAFHVEHKLRTVIWDYAGERIPEDLLEDIRCLVEQLTDDSSDASVTLGGLLDAREVAALSARMCWLLEGPILPSIHSRRDLPWPWL
jgi:uncharacterized repeat protein (TIGR03843 family)